MRAIVHAIVNALVLLSFFKPLEGSKLVVDRGKGATLELVLSADAKRVEATHKSPAGTLVGTFTPTGSTGK